MTEKKTEGRVALFIENIFAYGATTALAKVVPLIMLPIITSILTNTADYGRFDMYNSIVEFGTNIAVLGLYDAMFREFFEKDNLEYRSNVTSTALNIVIISSIVVTLILCVFNEFFSLAFLGDASSGVIVVFSAVAVFISACKTIIAAPIRMENNRKVYIAFSLGGAIVYYAIALVFIVSGYNYAGMIYANLIYAALVLVCDYVVTHKHFKFFRIDKIIAKSLLKIGIPLMPTFTAYWVFHGMDKIIITKVLGLESVGVYSVGSKVAQVSQIFYSAFAVGWQYFAFSTMRDDDQVELNTKVMEYLGFVSFILFILSTLIDDFVFNILFSGDYVNGVQVFPFLFLSPMILMLFQVIGNQSIVYKKSYYSTISLVAGAIMNLVLNYWLINLMGIKGSAIATLCSYIISFICIVIIALKQKWMVFSNRFAFIFAVTLTFIALMLIIDGVPLLLATWICLVLIVIPYLKDIRIMIAKLHLKNYGGKKK